MLSGVAETPSPAARPYDFLSRAVDVHAELARDNRGDGESPDRTPDTHPVTPPGRASSAKAPRKKGPIV